jgi:hypothetical protein
MCPTHRLGCLATSTWLLNVIRVFIKPTAAGHILAPQNQIAINQHLFWPLRYCHAVYHLHLNGNNFANVTDAWHEGSLSMGALFMILVIKLDIHPTSRPPTSRPIADALGFFIPNLILLPSILFIARLDD